MKCMSSLFLYCFLLFSVICGVENEENNLQMRCGVVRTLSSIYGHLNRKGRFPAIDETARTQEEYVIPDTWVVEVVARDNFMMRVIMPKNEVDLSEAIDSIISSAEFVLDCGNASVIAKMALMANFFSDDRINHIRSFMIRHFGCEYLKAGFLNYAYERLVPITDTSQVQLGDFLYVQGHPDYGQYSIGYGRGENTFCVARQGDDIFCVGYGPLFKIDHQPIEKIQEDLARSYIKVAPGQNFEEVLAIIKQQPLLHSAFDPEKIQRALTNPGRK